jgi:hypothetical protein
MGNQQYASAVMNVRMIARNEIEPRNDNVVEFDL